MAFSTKPIVIHAGFHKTGTSSVQAVLKANRQALKPHLLTVLKPKIKPLLAAARGYSTWRDPISRVKFASRAEDFTATLPRLKHRGLLISAEEISGHMPGRDGVNDYRAAIVLMKDLRRAFEQRFDAPDLRFVFTLRQADDWLHSAYWEHVKSASMTLGFKEFSAQFSSATAFQPVLARITKAVAPYPVTTFSLEANQSHPLGPADPLLRLFGLSDSELADFTPVPPANQRLPQDVLDRLLQINRTCDDGEDRRLQKRDVLNHSRKESKDSDG